MTNTIFILDRNKNVIDYLSNNGVSPDAPFFDDNYISELSNGAETYEFSTLSNARTSEALELGDYVVFKYDNKYKMFQIMDLEDDHKDGKQIINCYCEMAGLELLTDYCEPFSIEGNVELFFNTVLQDTNWALGWYSSSLSTNIQQVKVAKYTNVYKVIQDNISTYSNVEIEYRVEFDGNRLLGYFIDVYENGHRGSKVYKRFEYGENVSGITRKRNLNDFASAMIGQGKDKLTFKDIEWKKSNGDPADKPKGQDFVVDLEANDKFNKHGKYIKGLFDDSDITNPQDLLLKSWGKLKEVKEPKLDYDVKLGLTNIEYEEIGIGDTNYVIDTDYNPPIFLEARIGKLEISLTDANKNKCTLSNYKEVVSKMRRGEMDEGVVEGIVNRYFPIDSDKILVDGTNLSYKLSKQDTTIKSNENTINILKDKITLKVEQTDIKKALDDLELGSGNFILNSAFINKENTYSCDGSIEVKDGVATIKDATYFKMDLGSSFGALKRSDDIVLSSIATLTPESETIGLNKVIGGNINVFSEDYPAITDSFEKLKTNMITVPVVVTIDNGTSSDPYVEEWAINRTKAYLSNLKTAGLITKHTRLIFEPHPLINGGAIGETDYNPYDKKIFFAKWEQLIIDCLTSLNEYKFFGFYIGTNFQQFDTGEENIVYWTKLTNNLRSLYKNHKIIYRTNWWITASWDNNLKATYEAKVNNPLWEKVDIISIAAYFELNDKAIPTVDELYKDITQGTSIWNRNQNIFKEVKAFYDKWKKPVMFGELGCPSKEYGAMNPWSNLTTNKDNEKVQANLFEAYNKVFIYKNESYNNDWFLGYSIFTVGTPSSEYNVVDKEAQKNINKGIDFINSNSNPYIQCNINDKKNNTTIIDLTLPLSPMMNSVQSVTDKLIFDGADEAEIIFNLPEGTIFNITKPMMSSGTKTTNWNPSTQDNEGYINSKIASIETWKKSAERKITDSSIIATIKSAKETNGKNTFAKQSDIAQLDDSLTAKFNDGYSQGITSVDKDGIVVESSESQTKTKMDSSSFRVEDDEGGTVAEFSSVSYIPEFHAGVIYAQEAYIPNIVQYQQEITIYVDLSNGNDDNDGSTSSKAYKTIQTAIDSLNKYFIDNAKVTIEITGTGKQDVEIRGIVGNGDLYINFSTSCKLYSRKFDILDCGIRTKIYGNKPESTETTTSAQIINNQDGGHLIYVKNSYAEIRNICLVGNKSTGWAVGSVYGANVMLINCEISKFETCARASYTGYIYMQDIYGSDDKYVADGVWGGIIAIQNYSESIIPNYTVDLYDSEGSSTYYRIGLKSGGTKTNGAIYKPSSAPPPKPSNSNYKKTWRFNKIWSNETMKGWPNKNELIQGRYDGWDTGRWTGYIQMKDGFSSIRKSIDGATNLKGRIYMQRTSSSGLGSNSKLCLYGSDGTTITTSTNIDRGQGVWVSLSSSVVQKIQSGAIKYFYLKADSSNTATYFKCVANPKIEISYTK